MENINHKITKNEQSNKLKIQDYLEIIITIIILTIVLYLSYSAILTYYMVPRPTVFQGFMIILMIFPNLFFMTKGIFSMIQSASKN